MKIPTIWVERELNNLLCDYPHVNVVLMSKYDINTPCIRIDKHFDVYDLLLHDIAIMQKCIFVFSNPTNDTINAISVLKPIAIVGIYHMSDKETLVGAMVNNNDYITVYCEHIRGDVLRVWRTFDSVLRSEELSAKALSYVSDPYKNEWC